MTEKEKEKEGKSKKGLLAGLFRGSGGGGCCCNIKIVPVDEEDKQSKSTQEDKK